MAMNGSLERIIFYMNKSGALFVKSDLKRGYNIVKLAYSEEQLHQV